MSLWLQIDSARVRMCEEQPTTASQLFFAMMSSACHAAACGKIWIFESSSASPINPRLPKKNLYAARAGGAESAQTSPTTSPSKLKKKMSHRVVDTFKTPFCIHFAVWDIRGHPHSNTGHGFPSPKHATRSHSARLRRCGYP